MKNLDRISPNLILELLIWKVSRIQSSVFLINIPLLKENVFVQMKFHLWLRTAQSLMKRSKLRNKFLKPKAFSFRKAYTSQRNFCKKLLRYTKGAYFNNLDIKKFTDDQTFWKTVAPLFSIKFREMRKQIWLRKIIYLKR